MNAKDLQGYRTRLVELRARSRAELNRIMDVVRDDAVAQGEHDRNVSESVDKELILEQTEEELRRDVAEALQRIEDGTYGQCRACGGRIPKQRLDVIPFAAYCVKCERERENASRLQRQGTS